MLAISSLSVNKPVGSNCVIPHCFVPKSHRLADSDQNWLPPEFFWSTFLQTINPTVWSFRNPRRVLSVFPTNTRLTAVRHHCSATFAMIATRLRRDEHCSEPSSSRSEAFHN